jgi:hypothetical protein
MNAQNGQLKMNLYLCTKNTFLPVNVSCTRPSNEAPFSQRISGARNGDEEDTPNQCHRKQPPLYKSDHLMLFRAHTLTDCSLLGYL